MLVTLRRCPEAAGPNIYKFEVNKCGGCSLVI